jgi:hypothetical protein
MLKKIDIHNIKTRNFFAALDTLDIICTPYVRIYDFILHHMYANSNDDIYAIGLFYDNENTCRVKVAGGINSELS